MAITSTSTSGFQTLVQELVRAQAEEELRTALVHTIPSNLLAGRFDKGTNTIRLARYADLALQTTALTEGTPPTPKALTIASEAFSATQFGDLVDITDLAQIDSPHDLASIAGERVGRQAAASIDNQVREILHAGTNVKYSNGSARSTVSAVLTGALVKRMYWFLKNSNVPTFPDGTYHAIITAQQAFDLSTDTANGGWLDVLKYTSPNPILTNEIGTFGGVRFVVPAGSTAAVGGKVFQTAGASSADVHSAFFQGPGAYMMGDSQTLESFYVPPGGRGDELAQKMSFGWKVRFGAMLVDEAGARYVRLETAATSL